MERPEGTAPAGGTHPARLPAASPSTATSRNDEPIAGLDPRDPRLLQVLSAEHLSLLSERALVYNESFTRVGTFLTLVSTSLVALALLAQGMSFDRDFMVVATVILAFDVLVGLATVARILGTVDDDLRAVHGMSRMRHGYVQLMPELRPYFTSAVHDDLRSVTTAYGRPHTGVAGVIYGLSTSLGLMVLLVSLTTGLTAAVALLATGASTGTGVVVGAVMALAAFCGLAWAAALSIRAGQAALQSIFPSETEEPDPGSSSDGSHP